MQMKSLMYLTYQSEEKTSKLFEFVTEKIVQNRNQKD